jgi:hypothetical protein
MVNLVARNETLIKILLSEFDPGCVYLKKSHYLLSGKNDSSSAISYLLSGDSALGELMQFFLNWLTAKIARLITGESADGHCAVHKIFAAIDIFPFYDVCGCRLWTGRKQRFRRL